MRNSTPNPCPLYIMEKILQYVWQHRLWKRDSLVTNDGQRIVVIDPGLLNTDAGPDFFNAKLKIGDRLWAGNVEIHTRASDWFRHNHHKDLAYDSIILHVVEKDDCEIRRANGELIPQCELVVSPMFAESYRNFVETDQFAPCGKRLKEIPQLFINDWLDALGFERMISKCERINDLLEIYSGSWEDVCYVTLARSLGFGINNDAFERLARRTPFNIVGKISDSQLQIEALLFGQAGLLMPDETGHDSYYAHLCSEYAFLSRRFSLKPMDGSIWKFFRIRPQNFPVRRIALLSRFLYGGFRMMNQLMETTSVEDLRSLINRPLDGYWATHYSFEHESASSPSALSRASADILIINTVVPLLYAYGEYFGSKTHSARAVSFLEEMQPERNSIVEQFANVGLKAQNAFESQALIELRRNYCEAHKCIYCRIGHRLLSIDANGKNI